MVGSVLGEAVYCGLNIRVCMDTIDCLCMSWWIDLAVTGDARGSPSKVMVLLWWLKVIWGIEKSIVMGPRQHNHWIPKTTSTPFYRKNEKGNSELSRAKM